MPLGVPLEFGRALWLTQRKRTSRPNLKPVNRRARRRPVRLDGAGRDDRHGVARTGTYLDVNVNGT
jgi:hypothetical protein